MEVIPACFGRAFPLSAGQSIEIVTVQGSQVADTWAFNRHDLFEHLAMDQTRSVNSTIQIRRGMALVSSRRNPMLELEEDTSPGVHDTLLCACNAAIYRELGCTPDHRNCEQNLHEALTALGLSIPFTPAPFNLFMNVPVAPDGTLDRAPPLARPGDRVRLASRMDLIVVFSACPQDVTPINGAARRPSELAVRVLG